jgi:SAM-dependent methyltransferase
MAGFPDHFSQLAARYAAYRPHYPAALVSLLAERCARHDVAWDVGCGSGQLSVALASRFTRVIATDPAQAQLDHATAHPRVEYHCVPAEASGLPEAAVELAVAAQAAHWFDWPRFVAEAGRVVRPGGLVALVSYGNAEVAGTAALAAFYQAIEPYWPNGRVHVNNRYRDLTLPWPAVEAPEAVEDPRDGGEVPGSPGKRGRERPLPINMTAAWTREELLGYVTTWSATARQVAAEGGARLEALRAQLADDWPAHEVREIRWPLTIKLARR